MQKYLPYILGLIVTIGLFFIIQKQQNKQVIVEQISTSSSSSEENYDTTSSNETTDEDSGLEKITMSVLESHNGEDDCYIGFNGLVYNVSDIEDKTLIGPYCGTNVVQDNIQEALSILLTPDLVVGELFLGK
jgi:predicted heme/steroid binding protein